MASVPSVRTIEQLYTSEMPDKNEISVSARTAISEFMNIIRCDSEIDMTELTHYVAQKVAAYHRGLDYMVDYQIFHHVYPNGDRESEVGLMEVIESNLHRYYVIRSGNIVSNLRNYRNQINNIRSQTSREQYQDGLNAIETINSSCN